ncbi:DUF6794 domain-containing protein [Shewanella sp. SM73]|uniref:DUF6794 domain-containing protein n=1 Tax=Shewanella TaxID=22 RepID=UPI0021D8D52B|nr:DUF6794 domain-containing protein [Shewanella sp. SM73]MCU8028775.1 hypothetical protein [Shewanella sp. SM73]
MKFIFLSLLFLVIAGCTSKPIENEKPASEPDSPITCEGAIEKIAKSLDADSIKTLRNTKKEDLVMFHMSWGMGIRNDYGLWSKNSPIRKSCAESIGEKDMHPDNASGVIMEGVWEVVHSNGM